MIGRSIDETNFSHKLITLTNNDRKDIMKILESLVNEGILLKGTTGKSTSQERGF